MQNKICMVTGANSGIGKVTALELAKRGATVVMVCRNRSKGEAAQAEIKAQSGNASVDLMLADFASLASVRQLTEDFQQQYQQLHVLVNNAGLYLDKRYETRDGFEMTFGVNHLAHFLLTNLLLDMLKASAPARIINVSSEAHQFGRLDFDDLQGRRRYDGMRAYGQSKLANILFTYELDRRLAGTGVTVNSLHPGAVASNFARDTSGLFSLFFGLARPFMRSPEQGAETSIYLAAAPEVANVSGKYFSDKRAVRSSPRSYDQESWQRLWQVSEELVGWHTMAEVGAR